MKYMFLKSKEAMEKNVLKYIFAYYLLTLIYILLNNNSIILNDCIGLSSIIECGSVEIILKIISITLIIYITYKIYLFDIVQNIENIYLRNSNKKFIILNIIIILLFIMIIRLILLFIINFFVKIDLNIIFLDIIYNCFLSISSILLLNLIVKKKFIFKLLFIFILFLTMYLSLIAINLIYLIITLFIFIFIILFTYSIQELVDFIK